MTDTNRARHDPEGNRSHNQQPTPKTCDKRHNTKINKSIDTVSCRQWTNLLTLPHLEETEDNFIEKDLGRTPTGCQKKSKTVSFDTTTAKYMQQMEDRVFEFLRERQETNKRTSQTTATEGDEVQIYDDTPRSI